jgi:plasmid stability protein
MTTQTVTLSVPAELYLRLQQCAAESQRSIEQELLQLLTSALSDHTVPRELAEAMASLSALSDSELWQVSRSQLTTEATQELESLHFKRQREGLSQQEEQRADELERLFDRLVLLRSKAAVLLKQRGHDVTALVGQ